MMLKCPICGKSVDSAADRDFPFCSERCRTRDLGNWSAEKYVVSQPAFDEEEGEEEETPRAPKPRAAHDGNEPDEV